MNISLQYRGQKYYVYAIVLNDGNCPVSDFMEQLKHNNPRSHKSLLNVIKRHAENGPIWNKKKSRGIEGFTNLWEFKSRQGDRILYFYLPNQITILTHGFHKGTPLKTECYKATRLRDQYMKEVDNDKS